MILPAEWNRQWGVQLTWPHEETDWKPYLKEITDTYLEMARAITEHEQLIVVAQDAEVVRAMLADNGIDMSRVLIHQCPTNDTWARDHGFIVLTSQPELNEECGKKQFLDFKFNGWGEKFEADKDNAINSSLFRTILQNHPCGSMNQAPDGACFGYESHLDFVLEGGSIESDGKGTVFTTSHCLLAPHRNQPLTRRQIEEQLLARLHANRIIWIDHGNLAGDDTDGHIDTLVRIAPNDTLLYIDAGSPEDEQYEELKAMEEQLQALRTADGQPYRLLKLPSPDPIFDDGERLPATYANFLIINDAVLVPVYGQPDNDNAALQIIQQAFPDREMVPIDSRTIIRQHGSVHCCTMQFPL
ncbi:MAG: agmatine deiminase family protein [Prevotella sp.]|nr:agmatine deiminase family protein [Prevotella sp.]